MSLRRFGVLLGAAALGIAVGMPPAFGTQASSENGRIAFSRNSGSDPDIWSMRPNGGDPVNLTAGSAAADAEPSWKPDGRKLAFISNRATATNPEGDFEIFVMHANGTQVRQLTANTLDVEFPSWSPDGRRLVFQRDLDPAEDEVDYDLFTMKANVTHQRNLTRSPGIQDENADWSPNGQRIAFGSDRDGDPEVSTMHTGGGQQVNRTQNPAADFDPDWQPLP
jgi:TolB protein